MQKEMRKNIHYLLLFHFHFQHNFSLILNLFSTLFYKLACYLICKTLVMKKGNAREEKKNINFILHFFFISFRNNYSLLRN